MWQSQVEIEVYSVVYFDCYCIQSVVLLKAGLIHTALMDEYLISISVHEPRP